jgi:hypothetical protein
MKSRIERTKLDVVCTHCSKQIHWAWAIEYHSFRYTQLVFLCSECERVIKITNVPSDMRAVRDTPEPDARRKR